MKIRTGLLIALSLFLGLFPATPAWARNVVVFVADGLRYDSVNPTDAPELARLKREGVDFKASHAIFPTLTTPNASAIATGHYYGDTGNYGNSFFTGFASKTLAGSRTPFVQNNNVLDEMNRHFGGNYLSEESLLSVARNAGYATASIGKTGPAAIQDVTTIDKLSTIIIDDSTGTENGAALSEDIASAIKALGLSPRVPKSSVPNTAQQSWLIDVTTKIVLPKLAGNEKGFVLIYWSRDPDASQHGTKDSIGSLDPGINGPSAKAGVRNADNNLKALRATLKKLGADRDTDIFVTSDHGFSTISKKSKTSAAAKLSFKDVSPGELPRGFLPIDIAETLGLRLFDTSTLAPIDYKAGKLPPFGNALIGNDPNNPKIAAVANGGSGFIYVFGEKAKDNTGQIVRMLMEQDYLGGVFVDDALGAFPGALPLSAINFKGTALTPTPSIVVSYRSFVRPGCRIALLCAVEISDGGKTGQGMHGTFSRADTRNFMAASGPGFRKRKASHVPVSNADIAPTLAKILGLGLPAKGALKGRVIEEALPGGKLPKVSTERLEAGPAPNGLATHLVFQRVDETPYFAVGGIPGRVVGLPAK